MSDKIIYIVHCVDTEGPLYESIDATFECLKKTFGLNIQPSRENLIKIRQGEGVPGNLKKTVMEFVSEGRRSYKENWGQLDNMLDEILSDTWRKKHIDDFGNGYIFNWFIMDHVGFTINPRRRALGYHSVFEHYLRKTKEFSCKKDELQWHFHPVSFFFEAHKSSNNYSYTNEHLQVLSRRIIDHNFFPSAFRPGLHCERPDINLFLEQWIPFDYGNQGVDDDKSRSTDLQKDLGAGRFGDWRRATAEWEIYHPDFYDYQKKGNMRRYIARCLNLNSRIRAIDENEIIKAFKRSNAGNKTVLAITNHDEREMRPDIDWFYSTVRKIQKSYPEVKIKNAGASQAMREVLSLEKGKPVVFDVGWSGNTINIKTNKACWGPQPYFCFKTRGQQYIHENLDYHGETHWSYTFDEDTICLDQLESIGLATNDDYGNSTVWRKFLK